MNKLFFLIPLVFLTGCVTAPVKRSFPEVPPELMQACAELKQVQQTEQLSEVLKVVVHNYGQHHECKIKVDAWVEWYKTQKQIFDSVK
jgi:Na+-transporting methylmalonyl-CoA/oxaloacetate decarboxylase gamma subunit